MPYPSAADYTVQVLTSAGAAVDTFGGGVQYADGTAAATPTGTAVAWNDVGTERIASAAKPLPVNVVAGSGSGLSVVDAAAWTTAVSNFVPGGGVFNDSAAALASGTQGTLRMTAQRGQHINVRNNTGTELGVAANPFVIGGAKTNNNAVPGATNVGVLPAVANAAAPTWVETNQVGLSVDLAGNLRVLASGSGTFTVAGGLTNNNAAPAATNIGALTVLANAAAPTWTEGRQALLSSDLSGALRVVIPGTPNFAGQVEGKAAAGAASTNNPILGAFNGTGATVQLMTGANQVNNTTGVNILGVGAMAWDSVGATNWVKPANDGSGRRMAVGSVAHGATDAGNPLGLGLNTLAHGTNPTAVTAGQRSYWYANRAGIPWVIGGHPNVVTIRANYTAAQTDTAIVTVGAGTKIVVTRVTLSCDKANTVNVQARVGFGTANTPTTTGVLATHPGIDPGGGMNVGNGAGIIGIGADNEDLRITCGVPTTGSIDCCVSYYTIES